MVAIPYSVPRPLYAELMRLAGDRIIVSTSAEAEWLDNIIELGRQLCRCSSPSYLLQTKKDHPMRDHTEAAYAGRMKEARVISVSFDPMRRALRDTRPAEKPRAHQSYWQALLGQVGGNVRPPCLELTDDEKAKTRAAFAASGLNL